MYKHHHIKTIQGTAKSTSTVCCMSVGNRKFTMRWGRQEYITQFPKLAEREEDDT